MNQIDAELELVRALLLRQPRDRELLHRLRDLRRRLGLEPTPSRTWPTPKDQPKRVWWRIEWRKTRTAFSGRKLPDGYRRIVILSQHDQDVLKCLRSRSQTYISITKVAPVQRAWHLEQLRLRRRSHQFMLSSRNSIARISDNAGFLFPAQAQRFLELAMPSTTILTPPPALTTERAANGDLVFRVKMPPMSLDTRGLSMLNFLSPPMPAADHRGRCWDYTDGIKPSLLMDACLECRLYLRHGI